MKSMFENHEPRSPQPSDVLRHYLEDVIYGASDGIITTFTIISGVEGAKLAPLIVIILGFVNLFADGASMGAARYLSIRAGASANGMNRGHVEPSYHALCTFASFFIFGLFPLASFLIPGLGDASFLISCIITGITLFLVGSLRILIVKENCLQGGFEMLFVGGIVALIAYGVGFIIQGLV